MIAPLLWIAGALAAQDAGPDATRSAVDALAPGEARAIASPLGRDGGPADVGDLVLLRVEAASATGVVLQGAPEFDVALEVTDETSRRRERADGARVDAFEWTLRVLGAGTLEGGAIATPRFVLGAGAGAAIEVAPIEIAVAPALGEDEVAPRPVPGFRDPEGRRVGDPALAMLVLALLALLPLAGLAFSRLRARHGAGADAGAARQRTARERLRDLEPDADPAGAIGALAPIVRRLADDARGADAGALTDEEWAERVRAGRGLPVELSERAAALVLESSAVRYAGAGAGAPTAFAARDAKARAEEVADALARVEATPAAGAVQAGSAGSGPGEARP